MLIRHFKSHFLQILRDPIIIIMFFVPLLLAAFVRLGLHILIPFLEARMSLDLSYYLSYILVSVMVMSAISLGIVMGFIIIDDKDGRILELMGVTPSGKLGYLASRFMFVVFFTFFYSISVYFIINIQILSILRLILLTVELCMLGASAALFLAVISNDKVKALTYAKALNIVAVFCYADLLKSSTLQFVAKAFPTYWMMKQVLNKGMFLYSALCIVESMLWLAAAMLLYRKQLEINEI